jgi:hypothetical protein
VVIPDGWVLRPRCRHEGAPDHDFEELVRAYRTEHERLTTIRVGRGWAEHAVRTGWRREHLGRLWALAEHSLAVGAPIVADVDVDLLDRFWFLRRCGTALHRELDLSGDEALPWLAVVASTTDAALLADLLEAIHVGAAWLIDRQLAGGRLAAWGWAAGLPAETSAARLGAERGEALVAEAAARGIHLPAEC